MNRLQRLAFRAPIVVFAIGAGGIFRRRFLLLEHRGRRSGQWRRTVLEVVDRLETEGGDEPVVVSGFGERSQWYRNVTADPDVYFTIGRTRVAASAERMSTTEALAVLTRYRRHHPRAARALGAALDVSLIDDLDVAAERLPVLRLRRR